MKTSIPSETSPNAGRFDRWIAPLYRPVDDASMILFRIAFGGILIYQIYRYLNSERIFRTYIEPKFHFQYLGFGWVEPLPGDGMYILFWLLGVAAVCITVGFLYRLNAFAFGLGWLYIFLLEEERYLNHYYLVILLCFLMAAMPLNRRWSVDVLLDPKIRSRTVPAWTLWLLRAQIGIVYFYAGLAKLKWDWLAGRPTVFMWLNWAHDKPVVDWIDPGWMGYFLSYGGLLLDLLVVPFLLWRRTRWAAFGAALFFHSSNKLLFKIGIFPYFMVAATTLYFDPAWPRMWWERLRPAVKRSSKEGAIESPAVSAPRLTSRHRWWAGALTVYMIVQLLLPFRHHLYPGTVIWNEEGQYFAWHMLLRQKKFQARFWVTDPTTGNRQWVDPYKFLPYWQAKAFAKRPDLVVQFAHYLADELEAIGRARPEVRAEVYVSLNGRKAELLIDPEVDLAKVRRSIWRRDYIMPLTEPLPPMDEVVRVFREALEERRKQASQSTGSGEDGRTKSIPEGDSETEPMIESQDDGVME